MTRKKDSTLLVRRSLLMTGRESDREIRSCVSFGYSKSRSHFKLLNKIVERKIIT